MTGAGNVVGNPTKQQLLNVPNNLNKIHTNNTHSFIDKMRLCSFVDEDAFHAGLP
jgi:hypothetical protein